MFLILVLGHISAVLAADNSSVQDFITANNLFTSTVYKEILKEEKSNFLVSPFSAETILALTLSGSRGATAEELRTALRLPNDASKIEAGVKTLLPTLKGNEFYSLHTANKMYLESKFIVKDNFKTVATEVFSADSENIDFSRNTEAAETMNKWVEGQTENKIKNLIDPGVLSDETAAVLINALYFKSNWSMPFPDYRTQKANFYKGEEVLQVDTMSTNSRGIFLDYYENPGLEAKFLELPFEGFDASMTIVLPNKKEGLRSLENQIDKVFEPQNLQGRSVFVQLPKFKIESEIDFKKLLQNLGVKTIFTESADLSGISGIKGDLVVSQVIQKTFIAVDESGVEAAAATYVSISYLGSASYSQPEQFIADHPFVFYIKVKDVIIFAGRVIEPHL